MVVKTLRQSELIVDYMFNKLTAEQIADKYGITKLEASKALTEFGIKKSRKPASEYRIDLQWDVQENSTKSFVEEIATTSEDIILSEIPETAAVSGEQGTMTSAF